MNNSDQPENRNSAAHRDAQGTADGQPLAVDLFCGLGGWSKGFLAEGYRCIGFDIERHDYGDGKRYPGQLVIEDVLTLHGSQFRDATAIVASPPCQAYSYRAMPWKRAKALPPPSNELFNVCFRIQREACEAAGRYIPLVVENVKGAQPWVGPAAWHYGSFYLWGDVPALMPLTRRMKNGGGASWFPISHGKRTHDGTYGKNPVRGHGVDGCGFPGMRKAASAAIAEIDFDLAHWIARCFKPVSMRSPDLSRA